MKRPKSISAATEKTALTSLKQNRFLKTETFEEYIQKHLNRPSGKRVIFQKDPDAKVRMRNTNLILAQRKREMGQILTTESKMSEKSKLDVIARESQKIALNQLEISKQQKLDFKIGNLNLIRDRALNDEEGIRFE